MRLHFASLAVLTLLCAGACSFKVSEQNFIRPQPDATPANAPLLIRGIQGVVESRQLVAAAEGAALNMVSLTQADAAITVLYFGPNMFKISRDGARLAERLLPLGVNLIMVDHRGSGGSTGSPSLALLEQDALVAYDHVRETLGVSQSRLLVHGLSLGSFMAAHVAQQRPVAALVLEGSGTTVEDWAHGGVPWYAKPIVRLEIDPAIADKGTLGAVKQSQAPLLILAGKRDEQAPWKMSQTLYDSAATPVDSKELVVIDEAGHMDMLDWAPAIAAYRRLLLRLQAPQ